MSEVHPPASEEILKRIDGVVSQMEQELSHDLAAACVPDKVDEKGSDGQGGLKWIDQQIHVKERHRETCESRQAHLADLRRLVTSPMESAHDSSRRLSILEDEHEELKQQVEAERAELMKVRANLQIECAERLQEAGYLAQSVEESRQHAWSLQQAANERSREAAKQLHALQAALDHEKLQQQRLVQEAHELAGARVRQLEESSQCMVAENQTLQQKVRELELERSVFLEVQDKSEEERQLLASQMKEAEAQRDSDLGSLAEALSRIQSLESEKETLTSEVNAELQRCRLEKQEADEELHQVRTEVKELRQNLEEQVVANAQLKAQESPTRRLSLLEGGHEELRKQVENERKELEKVRANLQVECERRLQEERALAASVQENREQVLAAQEATNQRLREDAHELQMLQERLREAEAALEREKQQHMAAGMNLRQLQEENRTLQHQVRDMEMGHGRMMESHVMTSQEEKRSLMAQIKELEVQRQSHLASLQDAHSRIQSLQSEKETLMAEVHGHLQSFSREKEDAQTDLQQARSLVQQLEAKLAKQEEQVQVGLEDQRKAEAKISALESKLADEKQEAKELRLQVVECKNAGKKLQSEAKAVLAQMDALQQQKEELQRSLDARNDSAASASQKRKTKMRQQSLWAESVSLPAEEEEEEGLLPKSADGFVVQVREAHQGVDQLMDKAVKVHISSITTQLELVGGENEDVQELLDFNKEVQLERSLMVNELDARAHDLHALLEKVVLQHHLPAEDQEQVVMYIKRDIARCEEELEIMKPSDCLEAVPEGLIQELIHMRNQGHPGEPGYENGFTPMHWAARHGRRDLVEFIRQRVENGQELLRSRDAQGRIPLFFAKRARKDGLAYHLSRIGGFSDLLVRSVKKRPVEDLDPAYKKVLEEIEKHSWKAMDWKGGWTMLHWAAKHGKKDLCLYLLTQQADPGDEDNEGRSALDVAREANHWDLLAALQDKVTMRRESLSPLAFTTPSPPKE